jgi:hypothetical protein
MAGNVNDGISVLRWMAEQILNVLKKLLQMRRCPLPCHMERVFFQPQLTHMRDGSTITGVHINVQQHLHAAVAKPAWLPEVVADVQHVKARKDLLQAFQQLMAVRKHQRKPR